MVGSNKGLCKEDLGGHMLQIDPHCLPRMLYADSKGRIYDHPYFRMAGFSGGDPFPILEDDLMIMPEFSKLFYC